MASAFCEIKVARQGRVGDRKNDIQNPSFRTGNPVLQLIIRIRFASSELVRGGGGTLIKQNRSFW